MSRKCWNGVVKFTDLYPLILSEDSNSLVLLRTDDNMTADEEKYQRRLAQEPAWHHNNTSVMSVVVSMEQPFFQGTIVSAFF